MMKILPNTCRLIQLPKISDPRGDLEIIEDFDIPFSIKRVYLLSNVPAGGERGGHAHKALHQLIIATTGSFTLSLDNGITRSEVHLIKGGAALYVCPMIWREIKDFSEGAVCVVLASENYDEDDYYRQYESFIAAVNA